MWWGRKPLREEIERRKAAQISPEHLELAEKAAKRLSNDDIQRWRRIKRLPPEHQALFEEAMRLAERISNAQIAVDIFEHVAAVHRAQIVGQRRRGARDPEGDSFLLACYDEAQKCGLPGQTKKWSRTALAHQLAKGHRWGDADQIDERLRKLINKRNKTLLVVSKK